jgi:hypothetical protein
MGSIIFISSNNKEISNGLFVTGSVTFNLYSDPNEVFLKKIRIACTSTFSS